MDNQVMVVEDGENDNYFKEDGSAYQEEGIGRNFEDGIAEIEDSLAYCSEKLLNLEMFLMQVTGIANDFDTSNVKDEDVSYELFEKAFEIDILCGICFMEIRELESFMKFIRIELEDAHHNFAHDGILLNYVAKVGEKVYDAEDSIKRLQEFLASILEQLTDFKQAVGFFPDEICPEEGEESKNDRQPSPESDWTMLTSVQQRHILQQLEKSLARELDFEKNLSDSKAYEEDLKLKLHYTERELHYREELIEICLERMFAAENTVQLLFSISREFVREFHAVQFNSTHSVHGKYKLKAQLQENVKKPNSEENVLEENSRESKDHCSFSSSVVSTLRKKTMALETELRELHSRTGNITAEASSEKETSLQSEFTSIENVIDDLKFQVSSNKDRAESAEVKLKELSDTNIALNQELDLIKKSEKEKVIAIEEKLQESDTKFRNTKAMIDIDKENPNISHAEITDMGNMIKDLRRKFSNAESRAESLESKCSLLTETNMELNEKLSFLRGQLDCLGASLHKAESNNLSTANDIGIRTKFITDLVMRLALERENLHLQVSALIRKNKTLTEKFKRKNGSHISFCCKGPNDETKSASPKSSAADAQVEMSARIITDKMDVETIVSEEDSPGSNSRSEMVRTIDARQLDRKILFVFIIVFFLSVLIFYMYV